MSSTLHQWKQSGETSQEDLTWPLNTAAQVKKVQSCLFHLRMLKKARLLTVFSCLPSSLHFRTAMLLLL